MCNMLEKERKSATSLAPPGFTLKEFKQLFARGLRPLLTGTGHDWRKVGFELLDSRCIVVRPRSLTCLFAQVIVITIMARAGRISVNMKVFGWTLVLAKA